MISQYRSSWFGQLGHPAGFPVAEPVAGSVISMERISGEDMMT